MKKNESLQGKGNKFTKKFFCAAINGRGETITQDAENIEGFKDIVSKAAVAWLDIRTDDPFSEGKFAVLNLGLSETLLSSVLGGGVSAYEDFDEEVGIVLPAIHVRNLTIQSDPLIIFIRENFVVTIHASHMERFLQLRRYAEIFLKKISRNIPVEDKLTLVLVRIIDENNSRNFEKLREIEEASDKLNEWLMNPETPVAKIGPEIHKIKHALMVYLRLIWATGDVLNDLRYGDSKLISDNRGVLDQISTLAQSITGHVALTEHLSNIVTSGLEILQSIYNNQLQEFNNRLALLIGYLTIIGTAVLVPNTLGTILSGSAFNLTKGDLFWYLPLLVFSTIASTYGVYVWVKRKGLLTQKVPQVHYKIHHKRETEGKQKK